MLMKSRLLRLLTTLFLVGSTIILFFIVLNGASTTPGLKSLYWLQADTSSILGTPNRYSTSRWTYYRLCGVSGNKNSNCGESTAGYPISPKDNFSSTSGVPSNFINHRKVYYYLSKFAYAFHLLGLVFVLLASIVSLLTVFGFGGIVASLFMLLVLLGLLFTVAASSIITALVVKARRNFRNSGRSSKIGVILMALTWTSTALLLLVLPISIIIGVLKIKGSKEEKNYGYNKEYNSDYSNGNENVEPDLKLVAKNPSKRQTNRGRGYIGGNLVMIDKNSGLTPQRSSSYKRMNQKNAEEPKRYSQRVTTFRNSSYTPGDYDYEEQRARRPHSSYIGRYSQGVVPGDRSTRYYQSKSHPKSDIRADERDVTLNKLAAGEEDDIHGKYSLRPPYSPNDEEYYHDSSEFVEDDFDDADVYDEFEEEPTGRTYIPKQSKPVEQVYDGSKDVILSNNRHANVVVAKRYQKKPVLINVKNKDNYTQSNQLSASSPKI